MQKAYVMREKQIEYLYNLSESVYSNICLVRMFCECYKDDEEMYKLIPILKVTQENSDSLYAEMVNIKYSDDVEGKD